PRARDGAEHELHFEDVPEKAHAADRGVEQIGERRRPALDHAVVGEPHLERPHVLAEAAVPVMVLAVDVARHHAAEGHELRSRRDGREPAARNEDAIDLDEAQPRLCAHHPGRRVEPEDAIGHPRGGDLVVGAGGERRVAVRPPEPTRQRRALRELHEVFAQHLAARRRPQPISTGVSAALTALGATTAGRAPASLEGLEDAWGMPCAARASWFAMIRCPCSGCASSYGSSWGATNAAGSGAYSLHSGKMLIKGGSARLGARFPEGPGGREAGRRRQVPRGTSALGGRSEAAERAASSLTLRTCVSASAMRSRRTASTSVAAAAPAGSRGVRTKNSPGF